MREGGGGGGWLHAWKGKPPDRNKSTPCDSLTAFLTDVEGRRLVTKGNGKCRVDAHLSKKNEG